MSNYILEENGMQIKPIFIVTSFTNTAFGKIITTYTHSTYSHAAISFDTKLNKLYSFNADNKTNKLGGISIESIQEYLEKYQDAIIKVNCIFVKEKDFDTIKKSLDHMLDNKRNTTYGYRNIFNILLGKAKEMNQDAMSMVCSQFVSYLMHKADIDLSDKSDNLVTPQDLANITNPKVYQIYEGYIRDYDYKKINRIFRKLKTKALVIKESLIRMICTI